MLRLRTLGGLSLAPTDGVGLGIQLSRHRLALLARVAAGGEQGVSRAGLLFQFWPDSDEERGRRALNQIAYSLRRELGEEQLLLGTTELRLNSAVITSDVSELLAAQSRGDHERAVAAYGGPFLADFFLREAPEFERWVEEERARLAAAHARSLDALATAAQRAGDRARESTWLQQLAVVDPLNSRVAARLIDSLAASGDRAGALRFAQTHEAIVRAELETSPDPAIVALVAKLRREEGAPASAQPSGPSPTVATTEERATDHAPVVAPPASVASSDSSPPSLSSPSPPPTPSASALPSPPPPRTRRRWPLAAGSITLVALIAVIVLALRSSRVLHLGESGHRDWIVVTDVVNATGDAGFDHAVSLALTAELDQSPRVTVMPMTRIRGTLARMRRAPADTLLDEISGREVARREGARIVVVPAIGRADSAFVITVRIIDATTGNALTTELARAQDKSHVMDAIDNLAAALRRDFGESARSVTQADIPLPRATTRSLDALEKFSDGQAAHFNGNEKEAEELFKEAIAIDSDFAMAHVALGQVYYNYTNHRPEGDAQFARALALLDRLPPGEQMIARAQIAGAQGNRAGAIDIIRGYLRRYPDDPRMMFSLAYNYMRTHQNAAARDEFTRLSVIDSLNYGVWINLSVIDRAQHDYRGALAASARAFALDSGAITRGSMNNEYGSIFVSLGLPDSAERVFRLMSTGSPSQRSDGYQSLAFLDVLRGRYSLAVSHLDSAIVMDRAHGDTADEARHRLFMTELETVEGDSLSAREHMTDFMSLFRRIYLEPTLLLWAGRTAARRGDRRALNEILDTLGRRVKKEVPTDQAALSDLEGEAALIAGHRREARASFALALTLDPTAHEREEAAHGAFVDGDWVAADRLYRGIYEGNSCCYEGSALVAESPYWVGRTAEARGDLVAAVAAYDTLDSRWRSGDSTLPLLRDARARRTALARTQQN